MILPNLIQQHWGRGRGNTDVFTGTKFLFDLFAFAYLIGRLSIKKEFPIDKNNTF